MGIRRGDFLTTAKEPLELLTLSFEEGEISFGTVFLLQGTLVNAQDQLAQAQGDVINSLITLYKALGGGWELRCRGMPATAVSKQGSSMIEQLPAPKPVPDEVDENGNPVSPESESTEGSTRGKSGKIKRVVRLPRP